MLPVASDVVGPEDALLRLTYLFLATDLAIYNVEKLFLATEISIYNQVNRR